MKLSSSHLRLWFLILLALGMGTLACQGGGFLWTTPSPPQIAPVPPTPTPLPKAPVTFVVTVPQDTPQDGSTLTVALLDEVTGLSLNPHRVPLQPVSAGVYQATLDLSLHSVVKYRYERVAPGGAIVEFRTDGIPVRYRLLRVDGPMEVHDQVARWNDTAYNGPVGRIQGMVQDHQGHPLPDVLVTAGGKHTLTTANGTFLLDGLQPGTHNLVAYHLDQRYSVYQQLAEVAPEAATPASIRLSPRPLVQVTFAVVIPPIQPSNPPVRLLGNLYSLGNTFGDLAGGMSAVAARAPVMQPVGERQYALTLPLPAGAYLRYKYTLGDGYWNAERDPEGHFVVREFLVPSQGGQVQDVVDTWHSPEVAPAWIEVSVPADTPAEDEVSLQINPVVWTAPLPMWRLSEHRWGYLFFGPLGSTQEIGYRYCRNGACEAAPERGQYGPGAHGRPLTSSPVPQNLKDQVTSWAWYAAPGAAPAILAPEEIPPRQPGFLAGVALTPEYSPLWPQYMSRGLEAIHQQLHAQWVFLTPTWSATRINLPVFEPVPGRDPLWQDLVTMSTQAHNAGLQVALYPFVRFPKASATDWWGQAARDFGWWNAWFDRYRDLSLNFADAAAATGAQALVLGGAWITPALPGGLLPDGTPSGVPADAELRWRQLLTEIRAHYRGAVYWALPFPLEAPNPPPFLDAVDGVLLEWQPSLSEELGAQEPALEQATAALLDDLHPVAQGWGKPVILAPAYPAVRGGATGCAHYGDACLPLSALRPGHLPADLTPNLEEQKAAYEALFLAVAPRPWIAGLVVREFYPLAALQDPSPSVYGKPASAVIGYWFSQWQGTAQP